MRYISPEIFTDEIIGSSSMLNRLLWIGMLINIADDQGRMLDNPALMASLIFPYDDNVSAKEIDKALQLLAIKHKIDRYTAGTNGTGRKLIQIVNWWKYQKGTRWAKPSVYPAPARWVDRICTHISGNKIFSFNWNHHGGYVQSMKGLDSDYVAAMKRLGSGNDSDSDSDSVKGGVKESVIKGRAASKTEAPLSVSRKTFSKKREPKGFKHLKGAA